MEHENHRFGPCAADGQRSISGHLKSEPLAGHAQNKSLLRSRMTLANRRLFATGLAITAVVLILDQLTKYLMREVAGLAGSLPLEVTAFFNLVMVRNHGISFGMFAGYDLPLFLIAVTGAVSCVLAVWLSRVNDRTTMTGIAFVLGGALGNITDRIRFGAVTDFLDLHLLGFHWPAFNLSDVAIFIGVLILCGQNMLWSRK